LRDIPGELGVTGRNLAELCRDRLPSSLVWTMWIVSEIAAATDRAEFLGGGQIWD
jgi:manganese transport protein